MLTAEFPDVPDYRRELSVVLNNLGSLVRVQHPKEAEADFLCARGLQHALHGREPPTDLNDRQKLAITDLHLAQTRQKEDPAGRRPRSARPATGSKIRLATQFPSASPEYQGLEGRCLGELGHFLAEKDRFADALPVLAEQATGSLKKAVEATQRNTSYRGFLRASADDRVVVLKQLGRHEAAAAAVGEIPGGVARRPDELRPRRRALLAQCDTLAAQDASLTRRPQTGAT